MKKRVLFILIAAFFLTNAFTENDIATNKYFFTMPEGTDVFAISDGELLSYGVSPEDGMYIEIDYSDIGMSVKYCNLKQFIYLFDNRLIKRGDLVGKTGWTGNISEPGITLYISVNKAIVNPVIDHE
ncbi:MAG: peptidoglycan DD-metalloendopeptidase family protein [Treponema sp.]|nr:peptidoglycan DD-metalloendopeptidase family protein [Candidatus Treponema caballi]